MFHFRRYNFGTGSWGSVELSGPRVPSERYGHSVVTHDNKIYMYGGVMRSGHVSKELWSFDLESREWDKETVIRGRWVQNYKRKHNCFVVVFRFQLNSSYWLKD